MSKLYYNDLEINELEDFFEKIREKKFRAKQLFEYIHKQNNYNIDEISVLSHALREKLKKYGEINEPRIIKRIDSNIDKTKKYLIELSDGNIVEAVYMSYSTHNTICISTQVGCKMGCAFCASTKANFMRSLKSSELLNQVYLVSKDINDRISNVVLMGIGEPLDNYDNVVKFIKNLNSELGYNMSIRNITLSTCGIVPKIYDLANENLPINITISLHNPIDSERKKIMPIGKKYSIDEIIKSCKYYYDETGRRISFEYTLIKGQNDSKVHLRKLVELVKDLNCHINLIPLNKIEEFDGQSSYNEIIKNFQKQLENHGIRTTIRRKQGEDIDGACGQLRISHIDKNC